MAPREGGNTAVESRRATQMQRRRHLSSESPLLGGPLPSGAGAEEPRTSTVAYDQHADVYRLPDPEPAEPAAAEAEPSPLRDLGNLLPESDPRRQVDDWGRSERVFRS